MVLFNKPVQQGLGTNTNLVSPNAPFQSLDRTPNSVLGQGQMNMSSPPKGSGNKRYTPNSKANHKASGSRSGNKNFRKTPTMINNDNRKPKGFPLIVPPFGNDSNSSTTSQRSDFSYDITGQPTSTPYSAPKDDTLFKDWNRAQTIPKTGKNGETNAVTSYTKILTCDFKDSILDPTYRTEWDLTFNNMIRDVIRNTNASKGALDVMTKDGIADYIHEVSRLFTYLYELEVLMGWDPSGHENTNRVLRHLAQELANSTFLDYRTQMKEVLRSTVLPLPMLKYLRWLREYKNKNEMPESPKIAFRTTSVMDLIDKAYTGNSTAASQWIGNVTASILAVRALDPKIPALLLDKVDCVDFVMVKDYYGNACNRAHYDAEFNNIYNNRLWARGDFGSASTFPMVTDTSVAAFNTVKPEVLALANISTQLGLDFTSDLPMENRGGPKNFGNFSTSVAYSHWYTCDTTAGTDPFAFKAVVNWFETGDDSTFIVENNSLVRGIAIPRGDTLQMFYPGRSNINMAKRLAFAQLFNQL